MGSTGTKPRRIMEDRGGRSDEVLLVRTNLENSSIAAPKNGVFLRYQERRYQEGRKHQAVNSAS